MTPLGPLPSSVATLALGEATTTDLRPPLLLIAFLLALVDGLALLFIGRDTKSLFRKLAGSTGAILLGAVVVTALFTERAEADAMEQAALKATLETHLAYVITGDDTIDRLSEAGLRGLSKVIGSRTAVEPGEPIGVNLETDELTFFPLIYWPVNANVARVSPEALARVNRYMRTGGTIVFDTQDQQIRFSTGSGSEPQTANAERLREILSALDTPPLTQIPEDHVITKSFYLLREYPGRWAGGKVWVEAMDGEAGGRSSGGSLNDGVSSVIIGANDWAAAWAIDANGRQMAATVPGTLRQRELAYRFGVNLVMYTLTGNYKADQVHVPALLERLGK